jgi:hypothetical protein
MEVTEDKITIKYRVDYVDYNVDKQGRWVCTAVKPGQGEETTVTLVRDKPCLQPMADVCSYRVTQDNLMAALTKVFKDRNMSFPWWWQSAGRNVTGSSANNSPSGMGFFTPVEGTYIALVGYVTVAPCMSPGGGAIGTQLMVWWMRKNGNEWTAMYQKMGQDSFGYGDFNQKGLEQSINKAIEAAKLDQYKNLGPPPR